eukprot:TRINITY_DN58427_c0_g1_i1.p1 TRINITY_DN58427_c0_g1~~TRINITY_DN58427_c0_g1_i1.p1  ORF type:complete len:425 (+),score=53.87 TRINITY_DN58427_c0_g1_i1:35-1309(+)
MPFRVHALQHAPGEDMGVIEQWCKENKHSVTYTHMYKQSNGKDGKPEQLLPETDTFDWLVVLGGPMNVDDTAEFPWLEEEIAFIRDVIAREKVVIGICLGAQLVATTFGTKVTPCTKEIGWIPVNFTEEARQQFPFLPQQSTTMLWHGQQFDLPPGGIGLGWSAATACQGYLVADRVLGLQFHPEWHEDNLNTVIQTCADEIEEGLYVQSVYTLLAGKNTYMEQQHKLLFSLLDHLQNTVLPPQQNTLKINTSNANKFREFSRIFAKYGILLDATKTDLKEIDATPIQVIAHKATQVGDGVIVEDTSLDIEDATDAGVNVKWVLNNLTDYVGRKAVWRVLLGLKRGETVTIYEGVVNGQIVHPRGDSSFGFDPIFQVEGKDFTLAEMKPDNCNARSLAIENMCNGTVYCEHDPIYDWNGKWQQE